MSGKTFLPVKLVNTLKPSSDPNSESPAEPKVHLVACGNYESPAGGDGSPEEFSTQNVDPYVIKAMASELAQNKDWATPAGDVSAAFLNSPLGGSEWILLEPPAILKKLGLVKPDVLFAPYKAIYGLRRSPKDWSKDRSSRSTTRRLPQPAGKS